MQKLIVTSKFHADGVVGIEFRIFMRILPANHFEEVLFIYLRRLHRTQLKWMNISSWYLSSCTFSRDARLGWGSGRKFENWWGLGGPGPSRPHFLASINYFKLGSEIKKSWRNQSPEKFPISCGTRVQARAFGRNLILERSGRSRTIQTSFLS